MFSFKTTLYKPTTIFFSGKEKQLELHFLGDQPDFLEDVDTRKLLQKSRQSRKNAFNLNSGLFATKKIDKKNFAENILRVFENGFQSEFFLRHKFAAACDRRNKIQTARNSNVDAFCLTKIAFILCF